MKRVTNIYGEIETRMVELYEAVPDLGSIDVWLLDPRTAHLLHRETRLDMETDEQRRRRNYQGHYQRLTWRGVPIETHSIHRPFDLPLANASVTFEPVSDPILMSARMTTESGRIYYIDHPSCDPLWTTVPALKAPHHG